MIIDKKLISRLENLARLELSPKDKTKIEKDLNNILSMVEKLNDIDTKGVKPLVYINEEINNWREDEVKNEINRKEALKNAPDSDGAYFKVPKVIRHIK